MNIFVMWISGFMGLTCFMEGIRISIVGFHEEIKYDTGSAWLLLVLVSACGALVGFIVAMIPIFIYCACTGQLN